MSVEAPAIVRKDLFADGQVKGFEFNVADLLTLGYGGGDREISVRVTRANVPLPGSPLSVSDIEADWRYDAERDEWVETSVYDAVVAEFLDKLEDGRELLHRVRRRLRKFRRS